MSSQDDSFLARWSRRKQAAARQPDAPPVDEDGHTTGATAEAGGDGRELALPDAEPVEAEPAEPLPSLEDLTADGDLTGFLRKGVPKALQNAALRKMWSLDPAIRDHIGLSEYAWDFNQPGSMAGFGPLEAKESVAELLATMSRGVPAGEDTAVAGSEAPVAPPRVDSKPSEEAAAIAPDQPCGTSEPADPAESAHLEVDHAAPPSAPPSTPADTAKRAESSPAPAPPRHGGAVPR